MDDDAAVMPPLLTLWMDPPGARLLVGAMTPGEHAIGLLSRRPPPPPSSCMHTGGYIKLLLIFTFSSTVTSETNLDCHILSQVQTNCEYCTHTSLGNAVPISTREYVAPIALDLTAVGELNLITRSRQKKRRKDEPTTLHYTLIPSYYISLAALNNKIL